MQRRLIVIEGATGVGKTTTAIKVAKALNCVIVNADSRQVYKQMRIGTAVPSDDQLSQVKHYMIQNHNVFEPINAGDYAQEVVKLLDELFCTYESVVLVGGSGLYINAVLYGMDDIVSDEKIRKQLTDLSLDELVDKLKKLDKKFYDQVDLCNRNRVGRAVEVCLASGKKFSDLRTGQRVKRNFDSIQFALDLNREQLYERINRRVDVMISDGLEAEAKSVVQWRNFSALQTVGYREFFDYFDRKTDYDTAIELIKRNSRRYAKRQYTWLRGQESINWVAANDCQLIIERLNEIG